jgi:hypothetical protein
MLIAGPEAIARQLAAHNIEIAFDRSDRVIPDSVDSTLALQAQPVVIAARKNAAVRAAGCRPGRPLPIELFCTWPQVIFLPGAISFPLRIQYLQGCGDDATSPRASQTSSQSRGSSLLQNPSAWYPRRWRAVTPRTLSIELCDYPFPLAPVPLRLIRPYDAHPIPLRGAEGKSSAKSPRKAVR